MNEGKKWNEMECVWRDIDIVSSVIRDLYVSFMWITNTLVEYYVTGVHIRMQFAMNRILFTIQYPRWMKAESVQLGFVYFCDIEIYIIDRIYSSTYIYSAFSTVIDHFFHNFCLKTRWIFGLKILFKQLGTILNQTLTNFSTLIIIKFSYWFQLYKGTLFL